MSLQPPTWVAPSLPLIGLTGRIINSTPPLTPAPSVSQSGRCTTSIFKPSCVQSDWDRVCSNFSCQPGQITGNCSCVNGTGSCDPNGVCSQPFTCTKTCQQLNTSQSCPNGTYIQLNQNGNTLTSTCGYTPSKSNLQWFISQSGFPASFITGMLQRYFIKLYIDEWNTELYEDSDGKSWFHLTTDYTDPNQDELFREHLESLTLSNLPTVIPSADNFKGMMRSAIMYPQMIYSSGAFSMLFYVYGSPFNVNPSSIDISVYLQSFTMERPDISQNMSPLLGAPTNNPQFSPPNNGTYSDLLTNKYYIFVDLTTYKVYNINVPESQLQTISQVRNSGLSGDDFYVIGRVYAVPVQKLSPIVTYIFSREFPNLPFDTIGAGGLCDRIQRDTTQVPGVCFNNTCTTTSFSQACKSTMTTYCQIQSIPNQYPAMSSVIGGVNNFFLTSGASECQCFNTQLPPPINRDSNLPVGMCFTNACTANPDLMKAFGLTDQYCSQYCGEVYDWLNNPDPTKRSALPQALDAGRYQKLCGTYAPTKAKTNVYVLGGGTTIALVAGIIAFLVSKSIWVGLGFFLVILALGIYLSFDLNGTPYCTQNGSACQSSISHIPIPQWFCSYWLGCECGFGKACPTNNTCIAGVCIPSSPGEEPPSNPQDIVWNLA